MPAIKARYIAGCFERIQRIGGPEAAKQRLLQQPGREGKIQFLKQFPGIGDKYARNIMMDIYHQDFRNSIAIDARIQRISTAWGLEFASYREHEAFYLRVAERAGLNGWELDRLMFHFTDDFIPAPTA
jgi:endonuclease III